MRGLRYQLYDAVVFAGFLFVVCLDLASEAVMSRLKQVQKLLPWA